MSETMLYHKIVNTYPNNYKLTFIYLKKNADTFKHNFNTTIIYFE